MNDTIRVWSQQLHALQQQFTERGGVILHGSACVESPYQVRVLEHSGQERKLQTAQLTIATGSNPVRPRFASGIAGQLNDAAYLLECQQLPRECCVIGASVTGLRAACVLAYWGSRVTVIDGLNFSETTQSDSSNSESRRWADWADELGVHFAWGLDVIGMASVNGRVKLTLETGRSVMTRFVWFATGRNGQTEDLGLENTALGIDDRYRLWCNQDGITWEPAIHAVGDVIAACRLTQDPVCS